MTVKLEKGQRVEVDLDTITVGLGWKPANQGIEPDLDASVFMVDATKKLPSDTFFVFYNNLESPDGAVHHSGDAVEASEKDRDEEKISVQLSKVNPDIQELIFVVTIYEAAENEHHFGQFRDAFIRIFDEDSGNELARYNLTEEFSNETGIEIGRFYRKGEKWKFEAMGYGYQGAMDFFLEKYL